MTLIFIILYNTADSEILPVGKLLDAAFSLAKMRFEKKLSPDAIKAWWAEQAPHLSKDDILELADWMSLAFRAPPEIKKVLHDTLMKGDGVAMKTGFELWADEYRGACVLDGERKKAFEIADKLMAKGLSINDVADATGLTVDEILQR